MKKTETTKMPSLEIAYCHNGKSPKDLDLVQADPMSLVLHKALSQISKKGIKNEV